MKWKRIKNEEVSVEMNVLAEKAKHSAEVFGIEIKNKVLLESFAYTDKIPIHFTECIFLNDFTLHQNEFTFDQRFTRCFFLKGIHLLDITQPNKITFLNCRLYGQSIITGEIEKISFLSTQVNEMIVGRCAINFLELGGKDMAKAGKINFIDDAVIKKLLVANYAINELYFSSMAEDSTVFNCRFNAILFQRIRNEKHLKLLNCGALFIKGKTSHFMSNESNLGKAEFFQFDFSSFDEVNFINSVLNDCLFVNTTWKNNITTFAGYQMDNYLKDRGEIKSNHFEIGKSLHYKPSRQQLQDKKDVYRQLKYALNKQGDSINEQQFHIMEMNTYNKLLNFTPGNWSTKTILFLSRIGSNYGQSLLRPIAFLVIVNGVLFTLYELSAKGAALPNIDGLLLHPINELAKFIWFLNPFRKEQPDVTSMALIIDIIMRIVSSYCIYNIIRASRRFIK